MLNNAIISRAAIASICLAIMAGCSSSPPDTDETLLPHSISPRYRWVDCDGVVQYSDTIPEPYSEPCHASEPSPYDYTPVPPIHAIVANQGPDNDCIQGYVDLEITLGPDDGVANAIVIASRPKQIFDSAAFERVKGHKFRGAVADENGVFALRVRFEISAYRLQLCSDSANAS